MYVSLCRHRHRRHRCLQSHLYLLSLLRLHRRRPCHLRLRLMTLAEGDPRSKGGRMAISRAVVYQAKPSAR